MLSILSNLARRKPTKNSSSEDDNGASEDEDEPGTPHPAHMKNSPAQGRQRLTERGIKQEPRVRKPSQEESQSSDEESRNTDGNRGGEKTQNQTRSARSTRRRVVAESDSDNEFQKPAPPTRSKYKSFKYLYCF